MVGLQGVLGMAGVGRVARVGRRQFQVGTADIPRNLKGLNHFKGVVGIPKHLRHLLHHPTFPHHHHLGPPHGAASGVRWL